MNKIEINIPEGYEIDNEKSNLSKGIIEFKPVEKKKLSYEDIAQELFKGKLTYYITENGRVDHLINKLNFIDTSNATSREQLECLMAYNKLRNVAEYLNKDWKPKWDSKYPKYYICINSKTNKFEIQLNTDWILSNIYFATEELAKQAVSILGKEEVKKALFIY